MSLFITLWQRGPSRPVILPRLPTKGERTSFFRFIGFTKSQFSVILRKYGLYHSLRLRQQLNSPLTGTSSFAILRLNKARVSLRGKVFTRRQNFEVMSTLASEMSTTTDARIDEVDDKEDLSLHALLNTPKKEEQKTSNHHKTKQHTPKQPVFPAMNCEEYWKLERVSAALKRGEAFEGLFRINERNYERAYVSLDDGTSDILVQGMNHRNRALHGDRVVVQLLPKEQWEKVDLPDILLPQVDKNRDSQSTEKEYEIVRTGKVVYISEKKHPRVTAGYLKPFYNNHFGCAHFIPLDSKVPRMYIPTLHCPAEFSDRPQDFESTLFIARIVDWRKKFKLATGELMRSLGEAGEIVPETEALLAEHGINDEPFSEDVMQCLPTDLPWKIPKHELLSRRDFRQSCVFSIDPPTARDLDDALSIKKLDSGNYEVGVHIADVSYFVTENTALDRAAQGRATSVYLVQKVIPMLPRLLCEELCSLNPGVDRLTFSVLWTLSPTGEVLSEWFGRSVIHSCTKLSYNHAQDVINSEEMDVLDWLQFPTIHGDHSLKDICQSIKYLWSIAQVLREKRYVDGALKLTQPKLAFSLNQETGLPSGCAAYEYKESNMLIEEFMLLANMAVAHQIFRGNSKLAILRRHPKPETKGLEVLSAICAKQGIPLDCSDSAALQASLNRLQEHPSEGFAKSTILGIMMLAAKSMKLARYFCAGSLEDQELYRHYALNVPLYTHFTSPIRRYPDILVHRLLQASLTQSETVSKSVQELQVIAEHCNDKKWASKRAQERSTELFFKIYIRECGPVEDEGVVVGVLDKAIDVISIKFGIVNRIYMDKLPLTGYVYNTENGQPCLHLNWKKEMNLPTDQPVIQSTATLEGETDQVQILKHLSLVRISIQCEKDRVVSVLQQTRYHI